MSETIGPTISAKSMTIDGETWLPIGGPVAKWGFGWMPKCFIWRFDRVPPYLFVSLWLFDFWRLGELRRYQKATDLNSTKQGGEGK